MKSGSVLRAAALALALATALALPAGEALAQPRQGSAGLRASGFERIVSEVRYVGLSSITPRDLEKYLPFSPGEAWREDFASQTKQLVEEYYARRGFYQAKASVAVMAEGAHEREQAISKDGKNREAIAILIRVEEGLPCTVGKFWVDDPPGFKSKHMMLRFKERMESVISMRSGDRYDEQVLSDRLRQLKEWLAGENFIVANTDTVKLTFNSTRTSVDVVVAVDYGDRVSIGFQGNTIFTKGELNDFIDQLRATGLGRDYVGVIQRRFADEYRSRAYNDLQLEVLTSEKEQSRHLTFVFHEGVRTELQELRWEGLSEQDTRLAVEAFRRGVSRLVQRGYFVEKDLDKGIQLVLEDLKARGHLSSKLISRSVQAVKSPKNTRRVRVVVQIAPGEQTMVGRTLVDGVTHFPIPKILSTLEVAEGEPFNPFALEEGLEHLRALYVAEGFLEFRILTDDDRLVQFTENNRTANIQVKVQEGPRIRIGAVRIEGLRRTRDYVVTREIEVKPDDWWLGPSIQEVEANIRKLGLFDDVRIQAEPSHQGAGYRDLVIRLSEAEPGAVEFGPGIRSDLGLRLSGLVSYNNLFGKNWIGTLSAEANRRLDSEYRFIEYKLDAAIVEPNFFGTHTQYSAELATKLQRYPPDFNATSTEFITGFERKLTKILSAKISYKWERIRQFDVFVQNILFPEDNRSMVIGSFVPVLTLDTRDNPFTTTTGWLVRTSLEYADPRFSFQRLDDAGAPGYQKWTGGIHRYTSLTKDIVWSNVVSGGFARSNISDREIPLIKLFRLGGYSTIRGFSEDAINVDTEKVTGTLTYINLRTQIDLPFAGELRFAPFLDAGNLYIDRFEGSPFFRAGAGFGLHYLTPVGPINLDWGYKLNPVSNEIPYQIHFSVGLI